MIYHSKIQAAVLPSANVINNGWVRLAGSAVNTVHRHCIAITKTKKYMKLCKNYRQLLITALALLLLHSGYSQLKGANLKGTVLSEKGEMLAGVTVEIKKINGKEKQQTTTSEKGIFLFTDLAATSRYDISCTSVGYEPVTLKGVELSTGEEKSILIRMREAASSLDQVVVVGYGSQQKRFVTGSVSKVGSADLNRYPGSSFAQQLTGKAAGVVINETSGQPGTDPVISIRGIGTLTAGRNPLVVVDGFPLSEGSSLNSINPQDIESIDILKDPASAAIYGSRAANGVIMVTTKKGKAEKATISFDVYAGVQQRSDEVKLVNGYDAATYFTEARDNGYVSLNPALNKITDDRATRIAHGAGLRQLRLNYIQPWLDKTPEVTNTDWLKEAFRKAPLNSYNLSITGSTPKSNYYFSANYFNQNGIFIENGLKRYSATLKLDSKLSDKLDFGISIDPSFNRQKFFLNNGSSSATYGSYDYMSVLITSFPFFSPYNADGSFAISSQIKANTPEDGALSENIVAIAKMNTNYSNTFRTFGNAYLSYKILKDLKFKVMLGGDYTNLYQNNFSPASIGQYRIPAPKPATAQELNGNTANFLVENTLTYAKRMGKHDVNVVAGYSFQKENGSLTTVNASGMPDDNIANINGASSFIASSAKYTWTQISYFGRIQYNYAQKYIASATMRTDGSSRFGPNNRWGYFPSLTAGWIASNENFFPKNNVLTLAKLRATWGRTGNNQIGNYGSYALVQAVSVQNATNSNYVYGNNLAAGFSASNTPNPDLTWETKESTNFGIDLIFLKKINFTAEYYNSKTKNLLLNVPVPSQSGFISALQNLGEVQNRGLELEAAMGGINLGKIKWNVSANIAFNKNKVLALAPGQTQIIAGNESNIITKVGHPIAEFYGYDITGVYKSQADITKDGTKVLAGTKVGDYKVADTDGNGIINTADRIPLGTYSPKFTYGLNTGFSYKMFDLNISVTGVQGRKIYDRVLSSSGLEVGEGFSVPSQYYFDNRFDPNDNPNGTLAMPNSILSAARSSTKSSTFSIKDASYLRLRNIQLSYTLPPAVVTRLHATALRIYVAANNVFTFTKYKGFNADGTTIDNSVLTLGQASTNYPASRSFIAGFNLSF